MTFKFKEIQFSDADVVNPGAYAPNDAWNEQDLALVALLNNEEVS